MHPSTWPSISEKPLEFLKAEGERWRVNRIELDRNGGTVEEVGSHRDTLGRSTQCKAMPERVEMPKEAERRRDRKKER